ncbi:MAG: hypothetical protein KAR21_11645 [Spirochaetales bacterium]|nr:hypothetical protein [Spirochaetales bacterium]
MDVKALDLFQAFKDGKLPTEDGYIVSSFFSEISKYSIYEIVAYNGVKSIYATEEGLTFQTDGNKLFVLVEPATYPKKYEEPYLRDQKHQVAQRFSELEIFTAGNQTKVMVSKKAVITYSAFTILNPTGVNFSLVFYNLPDVLETLTAFFNQTLNKEAGVPKSDARKATVKIIDAVSNFGIW